MLPHRDSIGPDEAAALEEEVKRLLRTDLSRALERSEAFLARAAEPGEARARALRARGNTLRAAGRPEEALSMLDQALSEFERAGDRVGWASTQTARIPALCQVGRHAEALEAGQAGLEVLQALGRHANASRLLSNMAGIHYYLGRPAKALTCYDRSAELARLAPPDPAADARRNHSRAVVLQQLGRFAESLEAARQAGAFFASEGLHVSTARSLMVQGAALLQLGRYGESLVALGRSRAIFAEHSMPRDVLVCELFLSACYLELGRLEETAARAESAARLVSQDQAPFEVACAHTYRGVALGRLGEVEAARAALREAGRWFAEHGYASWAAYTDLEQAELALRAGAWAEAEASAASAGRVFAQTKMAASAAQADLARAEALLGRAGSVPDVHVEEEVRPLLLRAGRVARRESLPGLTFRLAHQRGRLALLQGDGAGAARHLTRAIGLAERLRVTLQPAFRATFLDGRASAYQDLVEARWGSGRPRDAHRLVDRIKARTLVDLLVAPDTDGPAEDPRETRLLGDLAEAQRAYRSLSAPALPLPDAEQKDMGLRAAPASLATADRRRELESRIVALSDELELLRAARHPAAGISHAPGGPLRLARGEGVLEYFVTRSRILGFLSDRRGLRLALDLGSAEPVHRNLSLFYLNAEATAQAVQQLGPALSRPGSASLAALGANARALLARLHDHLYRPFGDTLASLERVLVVPHGFLHTVPFAALFDGEVHAVEHQETVLAPSVALWRHVTEAERDAAHRSPPARNALVLAHSPGGLLPGVDAEAEEVAGLLGTRPLTGDRAVSGALADPGARLLHVAAHGEFRMESPRFSALHLADGPFTARDAAQLRLHASLAVLSSCQSGAGHVTQADELAGLAAGFLMGGCRSLVVSRWRISDAATVPFMRAFYAALLDGATKAGALRSAQNQMLRSRWSHPFFWAAFGLVGAAGPL
ncbi:CHAT domain-containing protein [Limnochorda pilosa]|uniref:CHAT domain-containing protein n=1 Tax=Limnochorda pilosa TaxID=1555112 RepID=A0A0K2SJY0_LIMPI|nr:CHAT domain-containing tetratricopeptide repeat protein [Limnochorda pilosa]BAS27317.1 hypothetical protein LIP_1468 [Limnochorda pilosa]